MSGFGAAGRWRMGGRDTVCMVRDLSSKVLPEDDFDLNKSYPCALRPRPAHRKDPLALGSYSGLIAGQCQVLHIT